MKIKIKIVPVVPIGDSFPLNFYKYYYDYQKELRIIDNDISFPIESETGCIAHLNKCDNYVDNIIFCNNTPVGIVCYQNVDFLGDGLAPILYIDHFYIFPDFRRKGIGTEAVKAILKPFRKHIVYLCTIDVNKPANHFWSSVLPLLGLFKTDDNRCYIDRKPGDNSNYIDYIYKH